MDFPSFTCVLMFDSTFQGIDKVTVRRLAAVSKKAAACSVKNFSVTHFDENLEATTLLSTGNAHVWEVEGR
jgi:hypothetical protein